MQLAICAMDIGLSTFIRCRRLFLLYFANLPFQFSWFFWSARCFNSIFCIICRVVFTNQFQSIGISAVIYEITNLLYLLLAQNLPNFTSSRCCLHVFNFINLVVFCQSFCRLSMLCFQCFNARYLSVEFLKA